jgi:hypothetical protein
MLHSQGLSNNPYPEPNQRGLGMKRGPSGLVRTIDLPSTPRPSEISFL